MRIILEKIRNYMFKEKEGCGNVRYKLDVEVINAFRFSVFIVLEN